MKDEKVINRRNFLKGFGIGGLFTAIVYDCVKKEVGGLYKEVLGKTNEPFDRYDWVKERLLPNTFTVVPATSHPLTPVPKGQYTYNNELHAIEQLRALWNHDPKKIEDKPFPIPDQGSLISIGSSSSNALSRSILGNPWENNPLFTFNFNKLTSHFKYSIGRLKGTTRRIQDGKERIVPHFGVVCNDNKIAASPERSSDDTLKTDILFITRIPFEYRKTDILIFAGLHGPSIRAVEHLIRQLSWNDIDIIYEKLKNKRYFQIIFEVGDLTVVNDTTVPGTIKVLNENENCPVPIDIYQE